jgi:hypothetical protein
LRTRPLLLLAVLVAVATAWVPARALDVSLTGADIERALRIAGGFDRQRSEFHQPYIVALDDATVPEIEVVTELRRMVLIAESHRSLGDWLFTRSTARAEDALRPWRGVVTIVAHLRFNPMNVLVSVPPYEVAVGEPDALLPVVDTVTAPLTSSAKPGGSSTIIGARIDARFEASAVGQRRRRIAVSLRGETVAATDFDFARVD